MSVRVRLDLPNAEAPYEQDFAPKTTLKHIASIALQEMGLPHSAVDRVRSPIRLLKDGHDLSLNLSHSIGKLGLSLKFGLDLFQRFS
jgi:hypothetical protein